MIFTDALLTRLAVHYAGNKQNGQGLLLSKSEQDLNADNRARITEALLTKFPNCHERYRFHHASSLEFNEVYNYVKNIFEDPTALFEYSIKIVNHLHGVSEHPKIKPGELYTAHFENILLEGDPIEAIGLFKAESKALFADIDPSADDIRFNLKEGVELSKIEKGCLIIRHQEEEGYELLIVDSNGKNDEAQYWKDKFLSVIITQNEYLHTQDFLTITKSYVTNAMPDEFAVGKTEQIDILNRSMEYFKTHGNFKKDEFETEVLHHDELIQSFRKYDEQYRENNMMAPPDEFEISSQAVKRQARVFKNVIKLDKNFHIYVHGDRQLIEKGFDELTGKHYYKIYFDVET